MNISELKKMVDGDMEIDSTELGSEALRCPQLHNKYMCILLDEKNILSQMESYMNVVERDKWLYYTGKMSEEDLKKNNWEPFELAIVRQDVDRFIVADKQYADMVIKINNQKEKINYLESVIKLMSNRIWNIKSAIEWNKFTQGIS